MATEEPLYRPLLERSGMRAAQPREPWLHVPELVAGRLSDWCYAVLESNFFSLYREDQLIEQLFIQDGGIALAQSLGIELPPICWLDSNATDPLTGQYPVQEVKPDPLHVIMGATDGDNDMLLNIADYLLASDLATADDAARLRAFLLDSRSAWRVDDDAQALARRVPPQEEESYQQAVAAGDAAAQYLSDAWDAVWKRAEPSAQEAYLNAVSAIESILAPHVTPDDPRPSLGKMRAALRDKPEKWDTRFGGEKTVEVLASLLDELLAAQVRHGGPQHLANTLEEARDAVTIAVAVVALVRRGFLQRVGELSAEEEAEDLVIAEAALERYERVGTAGSVLYEEYVAPRSTAD